MVLHRSFKSCQPVRLQPRAQRVCAKRANRYAQAGHGGAGNP
jgi:hypothetical protein